MCPLYSSGRIPMYVAPIKISAMLTVIISSSSENPRCFLDLIDSFVGEAASWRVQSSARNPKAATAPNVHPLRDTQLRDPSPLHLHRRKGLEGRQGTTVYCSK